MFNFTRYRPLLFVAAGLLVILASINCLLSLLAGPTPVWSKETFDGWYGRAAAGRKVAGIVQATYREKPHMPLNLVMGQSTALTDLDLSVLERESKRPSRWLTINGLGSSCLKFASAMECLWDSGLTPHMCLLVIDPITLAGNPSVITIQNHRQVKVGEWHRSSGGGSVWLLANREYINTDVQMGCETARERIMAAFRQPVDVTYEPEANLYNDPFGYIGNAPPLYIKKELAMFASFGAFSPATYNAGGEQAIALLKVIRGCRHLGAKVVVVIEPSSSILRSCVPPNAEVCLKTILSQAQKEGPLTVFDMRATQTDDHIYDCIHLNRDGRRSNSIELAHRLKAVFGPDFGGSR